MRIFGRYGTAIKDTDTAACFMIEPFFNGAANDGTDSKSIFYGCRLARANGPERFISNDESACLVVSQDGKNR